MGVGTVGVVGATVLCAEVVVATPMCAVKLHNGKHVLQVYYTGNECCAAAGGSHMNRLVPALVQLQPGANWYYTPWSPHTSNRIR